MKVLRFINNKLEEIFLVVLLFLAVGIVTLQIITRYVLQVPLVWSEETARYIFLWLVWVGAAYATKERKHIVIDVVISRIPDLGKKVCNIISTICWVLFLVFMCYVSIKLTTSVLQGGQVAIGSGIPMWIPYASVPVGMGLMLFRLLQNCYYDMKDSSKEEDEA